MIPLDEIQILCASISFGVAIGLIIYHRFGDLDMRNDYKTILAEIKEATINSNMADIGIMLLQFHVEYTGPLAKWYLWHLNHCYEAKLTAYYEDEFSNN